MSPLACARRALVTGASGGVGRAVAVRLAERGVGSVLFARRAEALEETARLVREAGAMAIVVAGDATRSEDRERAIEAARDGFDGLDLLVNNAGVGALGRFHGSDPARVRSVFELNLFAAVEMTRAALPLLRESPAGCVANVGSVLGWRGVPLVSDYCASKFALRGWSEAVRPELAMLGVHVLHASPSTIASDFKANLLESAGSVPWGKRRGVAPDLVARRIVRGIELRRNEVAIGWEDWAFVRLARAAPWLLDRVLRRYG